MRLTYIEEARMELLEAVAYYEECGEGLGQQFDEQAQSAEDAILRHPEAWRDMGDGFRRKMLQRFPYGLVYHSPETGWLAGNRGCHAPASPARLLARADLSLVPAQKRGAAHSVRIAK